MSRSSNRPAAQWRDLLLCGTALLTLTSAQAHAQAVPSASGGTVVAGSGTIVGQGTSSLTVNQTSQKMIIDWRSFGVAKDGLAQFIQPSASAIALNRVTGFEVSSILGRLEANGQLFFVNPNGMVFGKGAKVDVAGLLVSTADITNQNFMNSRYSFDAQGKADAQIVNEGTLTIKDAGLAAFVAPHVSNSGTIQAHLGTVLIGGAQTFTLDMAGDNLIRFQLGEAVSQSQTDEAGQTTDALVDSRGIIDARGGSVFLSAKAAREVVNDAVRISDQRRAGGVVQNADGTVTLTASSLNIETDGSVQIDQSANLDLSGTGRGGSLSLKASAAEIGGTINLNGTVEGGTATLQTDGALSLTGQITANGAKQGGSLSLTSGGVGSIGGDLQANGAQRGGTVSVTADRLAHFGQISARGEQGVGGLITVAAQSRLIATTASLIDASGKAGGQVSLSSGTGEGQSLFSSGRLYASGLWGQGGGISVLGGDINLVAAKLNADGVSNGGTIRIGHSLDSAGSPVISARTVELSPDTRLDASSLIAGHGGTIDVWSNSRTRAWGSVMAKGGRMGGNGGLIELSSKGDVVYGGFADASALKGATGRLLLDPRNLTIDATITRFPQYDLIDPNLNVGNHLFGANVVDLGNGNVVITSPGDDFGGADAGAVYVYDVKTGGLISTLYGGTAGDAVGKDGITLLTNGNFVVLSKDWTNGSAAGAGAATWGDKVRGVQGRVAATNSLVGSSAGDNIGSAGIGVLSNGNYVVSSSVWNNGAVIDAGAVTWGNGNRGVSGVVSSANSLVGSTALDQVGQKGVVEVGVGNYVVASPNWDNGAATNAGAVSWGNGSTAGPRLVGAISATNSLVGTLATNEVGNGGVKVLTNKNYVVSSYNWEPVGSSNNGAATWGDGNRGGVGAVSSSNSLVGALQNNYVSFGGITALTNGHYVVNSFRWEPTVDDLDFGAVTWGNGEVGTSGFVSSANSLVGSLTNDMVGTDLSYTGSGGIVVLNNGNYVIVSPSWGAANLGAITWADGSGPSSGSVSAANSLIGARGDYIGSGGVQGLSNGNYVVVSPKWRNGLATDAGAVTWGDGSTAGTRLTGLVSAANSLVGTATGDQVGLNGLTLLDNGNYVVISPEWGGGRGVKLGAVTWGNGSSALTGSVSAGNSLIGSTTDDQVGSGGVVAVGRGNYVVVSANFDGNGADSGAVSWGDGNVGASRLVGQVTPLNSLMGGGSNNDVGKGGVTVLTNGNYVVNSYRWEPNYRLDPLTGAPIAVSQSKRNVGAVTWGGGNQGVFGYVTENNSLIGSGLKVTNFDRIGQIFKADGTSYSGIIALKNGDYIVVSPEFSTQNNDFIGAITVGKGQAGTTGIVSAENSLVGISDSDKIGFDSNRTDNFQLIGENGLLISSSDFKNPSGYKVGAVTFVDSTYPLSQIITGHTSIIGLGGVNIKPIKSDKSFILSNSANNKATVGLTDLNALSYDRAPGLDVTINPAAVIKVLRTGTRLVLQASNDITVNSALTVDNPSGNGGDLTFQAGRSITINQPIYSDNGNVTLIANDLLANGVIDAQRLAGDANITFGANGSINAGTGTVNLELRLGTGKTYSSYGDFVGMGTNFSKITAAQKNISPFEVFTFTADNKTMTYGATPPGLTYSSSGRLFGTDSSGYSGAPTISTTASSISNVGTYAISIAQGTLAALKAYYSFDFVPATFTVTKAMLTVRADDKRRDYNLDNPTFTASITGFLNHDTDAVVSGLSLSTSATRTSASGTYAINAYGATSTNYDFTFLPGTLTINASIPTQTLVFRANNQSMTYGASVPSLSGAYSFSGLYGSDTASLAFSGAPVLSTVASSTSNVGAYEIAIARGTLAALTYYYDFSFVPGVLTVTKAQLTVRADDKSREYGLTNPALTASISGYRNGDGIGVVSGLSLATAAGQGSNVGTYQIVASGASALNYDFSYLTGFLTVTKAILTVRADDKSREYGLANPSLTALISGYRNGDANSVVSGLSLATAAGQGSNVGTYEITASGASSLNYDFSYLPGTLTVSKALLTIQVDDKRREYGLANPTLTASISGYRNVDTSSVVSGLSLATAATQGSNVGTYQITASGASSLNYDFSYLPGTLTITKARLTVQADDKSREYGLTNPALTASISGYRNADTSSVVSGLSLATAATQGSNVGTYQITGAGASALNYDFSCLPGTLSVTKARLTVQADSKSREYGLVNPILTASISGYRNGDTISVVSGLSLATAAIQGSNVGTYQITASGASALNYDFSYLPGTLSVTKAILTVRADNKAREYGLANPALTASISGYRNADTSSVVSGLSLATAATQGSNVGTYQITGSGASALNYDFSYLPGTLTVSKALLTVKVDDKNREYGLVNPSLTASISGYRNGDGVGVVSGLSLTTAATQGSNVGTYQMTGAGASALNYDFSYLPGTLSVTRAKLTVQADDKSRQYGGLNPIFTATISGFRNQDGVEVVSSLRLATSATQRSSVGDYEIIGSEATAQNYDFDYLPGTLTITPINRAVARLSSLSTDDAMQMGSAQRRRPSAQTSLATLEQDDEIPLMTNIDAVYVAYAGPRATGGQAQRPN